MLLLDEPTASLDLKYQIEIGGAARRLHDEHGVTIVLSTHDLRFAASVCTNVVLLSRGRVLAQRRAGRGADAGTRRRALRHRRRSSPRRSGRRRVTAQSSAPRPARRRASLSSAMVVAVLAAPFIGSTSISLGARLQPDRCRLPTTSTRRSSSSPGCPARSRPRSSAARWPRRASSFRACSAIRWRRRTRSASRPAPSLGAMIAITFGAALPVGGVAVASLAGALLAVLVVYALAQRASSRAVDDGAAARRRHAECVLLGADSVRAVPQRLRADLSRAALADGRSRRRRLRADPRGAAVRRRGVRRRSRGWRGR